MITQGTTSQHYSNLSLSNAQVASHDHQTVKTWLDPAIPDHILNTNSMADNVWGSKRNASVLHTVTVLHFQMTRKGVTTDWVKSCGTLGSSKQGLVCRTPHLPVPRDCLAQWMLSKNSDCLGPDRLWILVIKQRMAPFDHWIIHQRLNLVFDSRSVNETSILKCQMAVVTSHFRLGRGN